MTFLVSSGHPILEWGRWSSMSTIKRTYQWCLIGTLSTPWKNEGRNAPPFLSLSCALPVPVLPPPPPPISHVFHCDIHVIAWRHVTFRLSPPPSPILPGSRQSSNQTSLISSVDYTIEFSRKKWAVALYQYAHYFKFCPKKIYENLKNPWFSAILSYLQRSEKWSYCFLLILRIKYSLQFFFVIPEFVLKFESLSFTSVTLLFRSLFQTLQLNFFRKREVGTYDNTALNSQILSIILYTSSFSTCLPNFKSFEAEVRDEIEFEI